MGFSRSSATIDIIDSHGNLQRVPRIETGGETFSLPNGHHHKCVDGSTFETS